MGEFQQSSIPAPEPKEPEVFDTTSPAFGEVTRFTQADWPRYARWLARRVNLRWPHVAEHHVPQLLAGYINANDSIMLKTPEAVGLFRLVRKPFQPLIVESIFLFTNGKKVHREGVAITRKAEDWGRSHNAIEFYADMDSDMTPGIMKPAINAKEKTILYRDLTAKTTRQ